MFYINFLYSFYVEILYNIAVIDALLQRYTVNNCFIYKLCRPITERDRLRSQVS